LLTVKSREQGMERKGRFCDLRLGAGRSFFTRVSH
jgi:hypothetical protein